MTDRTDRNDPDRDQLQRDTDLDEQLRRDESEDFLTDAELEAREANGGRPNESQSDRDSRVDRNPDTGRE